MNTARLLTSHLTKRVNRTSPFKLSKRYHVVDKKHHVVPFDDWSSAGLRATGWDFQTLHFSQTKIRRCYQVTMWLMTYYLLSNFIKFHVQRKRTLIEEKWDYQSKYWKDGYWLKEFPDGLVVKKYNNGKPTHANIINGVNTLIPTIKNIPIPNAKQKLIQ